MRKTILNKTITGLLIGILSMCVGIYTRSLIDPKLCSINGLWSGKFNLTTTTGFIRYKLDLYSRCPQAVFSFTADAGNGHRFVFKLNANVKEYDGNKVVFLIKDRTSVWLDNIRKNNLLDIPIQSDIIEVTIEKINDNKLYMTQSIGDYYYGTILVAEDSNL